MVVFSSTHITIPLKRTREGSVTAHATLRFIALDAPTYTTAQVYAQYLQRHCVKCLVRFSEKTYPLEPFEQMRIPVIALPFNDSTNPPIEIVDQWLQVVDDEISKMGPDGTVGQIALHCLSGLYNGPLMLAIALMEFGEFTPAKAIEYLRQARAGVLDDKQVVEYIMQYKQRWRRSGGGCCIA